MAEESIGSGVKKGGGLFVVLGILTLVLGFVSMGAPLMTGLAVTILIGSVLIVNGLMQAFHGFKVHGAGPKTLAILIGVLTVVAGGVILSRPVFALATLTLIVAIFFVIEGVFTMLMAFQLKPEKGWGWLLFNSIVSIVLGIMIWRQWPVSGVWAIGILVGVRIFMSGFGMIFVGSATRQIGKDMTAQST
jgi:uncharacterized membrane protein HdeD (DUF308 family)